MVEATAARGLDLAVVTNGYHLAEAVGLLRKARIREIQVTLDGTEKVLSWDSFHWYNRGIYTP